MVAPCQNFWPIVKQRWPSVRFSAIRLTLWASCTRLVALFDQNFTRENHNGNRLRLSSLQSVDRLIWPWIATYDSQASACSVLFINEHLPIEKCSLENVCHCSFAHGGQPTSPCTVNCYSNSNADWSVAWVNFVLPKIVKWLTLLTTKMKIHIRWISKLYQSYSNLFYERLPP